MDHPPISDVLAYARGERGSEVGEHVAHCDACRRLVDAGDPFGRAPIDRSLVDPPTIERDQYRIREQIRDAHSGMGRAFRAFDRRLGREVVIKQTRDVHGPAAAILNERFQREARLTARLQHPGIVGVHELGRWPDGEPFYTMPLVDGSPLDEVIAKTATTAERLSLLPRITAIAEAVAYAHERGVIHRDIKPANIILGAFGETVLIDWGLAKLVDDAAEPIADLPASGDGVTRLGIGTAAYMPLEQARGEIPDARADVYALGATLYHVLSGQPPYGSGTSDAVRARLLAGPPAPLAEVWPDGPPELVAIVDKAMARDRMLRFASALELAEELRRFTTGQLIRSHAYRPGELLRHWLRRHRVAVRIGAVAITAIGVVSAIAIVRVVRERDRAERATAAASARAREAATALALSQIAQARLLAITPTGRAEALDLALRAFATDPREEVWRGIVEVLANGPVAVPLSADTIELAASPTGDTLLALTAGNRVELRDARTGAVRHALTVPVHGTNWARWSADGRHAAVLGIDGTVAILDATTGTQRSVVAARDASEPALAAFLANGTLVTASAGQLRAWDPATGAQRGETSGCAAVETCAAGDLVAVGCESGELIVWDTSRTARLPAHRAHVAVACDATHVYTMGAERSVLAWDASALRSALGGGPTPSRRTLVADAGAQVYAAVPVSDTHLAVSAGLTLFVDERDGTVRREPLWSAEHAPPPVGPYVFGKEGTRFVLGLERATFEPAVRLAQSLAFEKARVASAARGERVAVVTDAGEAVLWDARRGLLAGALPSHDGEIVALLVDPTADRVISASVDGLVRVARLADGSIVATTRLPSEIVATAASRDVLATGQADGSIRVWRTDGSAPLSLGLGAVPVAALAFDKSGKWLAAGDLDGTLAIWSLGDAAQPRRRQATGKPVTAIALGPDAGGDVPPSIEALASDSDVRCVGGVCVRYASDGAITARDAPGRERPLRPAGPRVVASAMTADGSRLVEGSAAGVTVWDVGGATQVWSLPPRAALPTAFAFTPDHHWLLAGYADGEVLAHPLDAGAAVARACATLAGFGRTAGLAACPLSVAPPTRR